MCDMVDCSVATNSLLNLDWCSDLLWTIECGGNERISWKFWNLSFKRLCTFHLGSPGMLSWAIHSTRKPRMGRERPSHPNHPRGAQASIYPPADTVTWVSSGETGRRTPQRTHHIVDIKNGCRLKTLHLEWFLHTSRWLKEAKVFQ